MKHGTTWFMGVATFAGAIALFAGADSHSARAMPPPAYRGLELHFLRSGAVIQSIHVVAKAPFVQAMLRLRVLRGDAVVGQRGGTVVYQRVVAMTDIARPDPGPNGVVARAVWSGSLDPRHWRGGCRHTRYAIEARVETGGGLAAGGQTNTTGTSAFFCR